MRLRVRDGDDGEVARVGIPALKVMWSWSESRRGPRVRGY
jgi:hypothetical protein